MMELLTRFVVAVESIATSLDRIAAAKLTAVTHQVGEVSQTVTTTKQDDTAAKKAAADKAAADKAAKEKAAAEAKAKAAAEAEAKAKAEAEAKAAAEAAKKPKISIDDVRKALRDYAAIEGKEAAVEILATHGGGAASVSDLAEEHYQAVLEAATK